jgi:hypothetical protein
MSRHLGRFRVQDGRITGRVGDYEPPAQKTEVSRFKGEHHVAERDSETGDLVIFSIGNSDGIPGVEQYTADRAPKNLTDLQKLYDEAYSSRRRTFEQRADSHSTSQALADHVRR